MGKLTDEQIDALPPLIRVTRGCDNCKDPIMTSFYYSGHGKDFCSRKCQVEWEEENLTKKGKKMSKKSKKSKHDEDEDTKKKKRSREDDDDDDDDSNDDDADDDAGDDDDEDDDRKSKKKDKKKKSKDKDKKSSKKDKGSKDKDKKKSSSKAGSGAYREGSNSAIMFERLSDQKRHSFKEVFKKIDSPLPTLRRLERHAEKHKKFKLDIDRENETIRMKKL